MKKIIAEWLYKNLKQFIVIESGKNIITKTPFVKIYIFDEKVGDIEWSELEMMFKNK